jgi:ATP/maltotriose-dependent transcriptional regulator MalT
MMNSTISRIATKLHIPSPRSASLRRLRLHRKLDRCIEAKLIAIAAPAGFGKTTLLGEWSETSNWPLAWVSLDQADNDRCVSGPMSSRHWTNRPLFCLIYAWVLCNTGQIREAESYLDHLEATLPDDAGKARLLGEAATVRARIAVMRGETAQNIHFSQRALELLPQDASVLRGDTYLNLSFALRDRQAWQAAQDTFEKAIDLGRKTDVWRLRGKMSTKNPHQPLDAGHPPGAG